MSGERAAGNTAAHGTGGRQETSSEVSWRGCWATYAAALVAGVCTYAWLLSDPRVMSWEPLLPSLVANIAATMTVFLSSVVFNNSSLYDPYWVLPPSLLAVVWLYDGTVALVDDVMLHGDAQPRCGGPDWFALWLALLVNVWAWRYHLRCPWEGWHSRLTHHDWRYEDVRAKLVAAGVGFLWWPVSLLSFHLTPTLLVHAAAAPLHRALTVVRSGAECNAPLQGASLLCVGVAIVWLWRADEQLRDFRERRGRSAGVPATLRTGLWGFSRHPNYFGEAMFWVALLAALVARLGGVHEAAAALGTPLAPWWTPLGTAAMVAFFRFASVPLMDARSLSGPRGAEYAVVMREVSPFFPWPPLLKSSKTSKRE